MNTEVTDTPATFVVASGDLPAPKPVFVRQG